MTTNLASLIDHTLLKPEATAAQIRQLCAEARRHQFYSVCIQPHWLADARRLLADSNVKVCTVVGFPLGASQSQTKAFETRLAVESGADEIDFVINLGAALENHYDFIEHEIHEVVSAAEVDPSR